MFPFPLNNTLSFRKHNEHILFLYKKKKKIEEKDGKHLNIQTVSLRVGTRYTNRYNTLDAF